MATRKTTRLTKRNPLAAKSRGCSERPQPAVEPDAASVAPPLLAAPEPARVPVSPPQPPCSGGAEVLAALLEEHEAVFVEEHAFGNIRARHGAPRREFPETKHIEAAALAAFARLLEVKRAIHQGWVDESICRLPRA